MKITYTTNNKRISAEIEGDSPQNIFEQISKFKKYLNRTSVAEG